MCGIVGFISFNNNLPDDFDIQPSIRLLEHRGPDDEGKWVSGNVALGFRRLSIQDLSIKGRQPMFSDDKRYVIIHNGEIYNFKILRKELEERGFVFKTGTDAEVLLKLYQLEGKSCLPKLNGMFAFAIYDTIKKSLFIARDRFGIKPLYTLRDKNGFFFASEMKALLPFVQKYGIPWELNESHIFEYMLFRYVSGQETLIKNLLKCKPGSWLEIGPDGSIKEGLFYDVESISPSLGSRQNQCNKSEEDYLEQVKDALKESIRLRMISDAPIGVALSGGVDSSLITALMREIYDGPIDTFSVVFPQVESGGRRIDESEFSDFVAHKFETNHHREILDENLFSELYLKVIWHNDEPLNFPHCAGIYLLSKFAAEKVKVLLGGEGADETFAGYDYFASPRLYPLKNRFVRVEDAQKLINGNITPLSNRQELISKCRFKGVNKEICYSLNTYLTTIENRLDKMSMAAGLEMRVPFLDHNIVETSLRLPDRYKVGGRITKYILKKLAERYIPREQIYRPKIGFSTPLNEWMRNDKVFGKYVDILREERTLNRPIYNKRGIQQLVANFKKGNDTFRYSYAGRVWILMNLELWIRTFIEEKQQLTFSS